tara:strand:- start:267 stop:443 length:177 start_codon:yes stop_codon:yes gene_type:complete
MKLTSKQLDVLHRGLALAQLWIDEIPALVEEDFEPGTFERWGKDHYDFEQLIKELSHD